MARKLRERQLGKALPKMVGPRPSSIRHQPAILSHLKGKALGGLPVAGLHIRGRACNRGKAFLFRQSASISSFEAADASR